jgi:glycosyltransferase involved in cell wall biosynthesis
VRETVQDGRTGLLVDDESQLAAAIQRLMDDPSLADDLGRRAREVVYDRWSLDAAVDELERHLLAVAGRR